MPATRLRETGRRAALLLVASAGLAAGGPAVARDEVTVAGGGALRIAADPPRLLLGRDAGADLRIAAPPAVEDVVLTASVGRVEGLRRLPGGGFAARYRAPGDRIPQVAIVAALGRTAHGLEDGWLAIPLSGQGDARIRAAPGARIALQIGDRTFGPRTAGADGVVVIPVIVPPGVREAHHGFRPIDLHVPDTPLLHAVLDRSVVLADRLELVRVLAYVVAPHGAARRGDVPLFEPSRGTVTVSEREAGAVEALWSLPPGRAGEERLTVRLPASPASRAVLKLDAVAGAPAVVAVSFDREALVAGEADAVTVTARALDAAGNAVPAALELSSDAGELTGERERTPGEVEARLHAGPSFAGRRQIRVTATAPGVGISGARALPLRPGEPARARFARADGVVRADGRREAVLRVSVVDRHGNAVDVAPAVTAEHGKILSVEEAGAGEFDVRYLPPAVDAPTTERLVAQVGPARARAERLLVPPGRNVSVDVSAGVALDLRGREATPQAVVAVEREADLAFAARWGAALAWRGEVRGLSPGAGRGVALLGGVSLRRALTRRLELGASASAGALAADRGASPAGELALRLGLRARVSPFLEATAFGAGRGGPGAFAAVGLSAGVRFGVERRDGDHPHRR